MNQDRDGLQIRNLYIGHGTARRDWVCGCCGASLATRWFEQEPNWRTVCTNDPEHPADSFVHKASWAYRQARCQLEAMQAGDVFDHLPPELRADILTHS